MSSSAIIAYLDCVLYVEETMTTIHIDLYNNSNSNQLGGEQEIWICKGFWCFLTGVSNKDFNSFYEKCKQLNADETLSNEECQVMLEQHIMKAEKDSIDIIDRNMAGFDAWMNRVSFSFDELD